MPEPQGPTTAPKEPVKGTTEPSPVITDKAPVDDKVTIPTPPVVDSGQAKADDADKSKTPVKSDDAGVFFDPKDLPEELTPIYKQMQSAFTKKTQAIAAQREKVEMYDAFMSDIPGNLRKAAEQYGFRMVPAQQGYQPQAGVDGQITPFSQEWQPQTYEELYQAVRQRLDQEINQRFQPVFDSVQKMTTTTVERQLSEIDPNWRIYEDEMATMLRAHPTLANDIGKLYRISVPEEVLQSRAVQVGLKKMEDKAKSAKVQGKSTTAATTLPNKKMSFHESVEAAKQILNQK